MAEVNQTTQETSNLSESATSAIKDSGDIKSTESAPQATPSPRTKQRPLSEILSTGMNRRGDSNNLTPKEGAPADISETIHTVMRLVAETKKVADAALRERVSAITSQNPNNRNINRAYQMVSAISLAGEGSPRPENWELSARTESLYSLREQIVNRVMLRNRRVFESSGIEEGMRMVKSLATFRRASRSQEIRYCGRENMVPGSANTDSNVLTDSPRKAKMAALEETLYCISALVIGATKDSLPKLQETEVIEIQKNSILLQNPNSPRPIVTETMENRLKDLDSGTKSKERLLSVLTEIFTALNPDEKSKNTLKREIELFDEIESSIGSNIEEVDSLSSEEKVAVRLLEDAYAELEKTERLSREKPASTKEEVSLKIFQGLREIAGNLGRTTTLVLTAQLAKDEVWLKDFAQNGADAIYNANAYKKLITLTEPENTLFGDPSDPDKFMEEGKTLRDALGLIYQAESAIYSGAIYESIAQSDREDLQLLAEKVLHSEISTNEMEENPILKSLATIQSNAEKMAAAVTKEVEGSQTSLELLPRALKEKERQEQVALALSSCVKMLAKSEVSSAIESLIKEDTERLEELRENVESSEQGEDDMTTKAQIVNTKEKLATLEALRDLGKDHNALEGLDYTNLLGTISLTRVPRTLREHALISLCDNKAANETKLKTKETLVRIEALSKEEGLTNAMRANLGRLRHWKERETIPQEINKHELAISICRTPENLKRTIPRELTSALKSCIACPPWKDPFHISPRDLGNCNGTYLVAKNAYSDDERIWKRIKSLHARTSALQKEAGKNPITRGEKIGEDLRSNKEGSLKSIESGLLRDILDHKQPKEALDYLESWYHSIGHEQTLHDATIKEVVNNSNEKNTQEVLEVTPEIPSKPERGTKSSKKHRSNTIPYVAAKIQTKIENLLEIGRHFKEVSKNPEALAETYIQHRLHINRGVDKESWEQRIERAQKKVDLEINKEKKELEDWKLKFNAYFDDNIEEEVNAEEAERSRSIKNVCFLKISQKERAIETLYLKRERLRSLGYTSKSLKRIENPDEVTHALRNQEEEKEGLSVSMGTALDAAFALAGNPEKIMLPKKKMSMATPLQMLEAGTVEKTINSIRGVLKEAAVVLKERDPSLAELDLDNKNPEAICGDLKTATFKILKEVEMHLWESGKSVKLSREEEEDFLKNNPEMLATRKEWIDQLQKSSEELKTTVEYAKLQPRKKEKQKQSKPKSVEKGRESEDGDYRDFSDNPTDLEEELIY
jgi:hypothetical protein